MSLTVDRLRCEYRENPLGIDAAEPRFSWILLSDRRNTRQAAYHIQVAASREALTDAAKLVWDSGVVDGDSSIWIGYEGDKLASFQRYWWRVKVRDNHGRESEWSQPAWFEMGILKPAEWTAEWISPDLEEKEEDNPCPMLRKEFDLKGRVSSARAYVTSLGLYEMEINGCRVGDARFTPGFTSFHKRLQYQTYDVTDYLREGQNAVGAFLADGWYRGHLWFKAIPNVFGRELALLAQIRVEYEDGTIETIGTDASWQCTTGPILSSDLYYGEVYDARWEIPGWSEPGCAYDKWRKVKKLEYGKAHLVCSPGGVVKVVQEIQPRRILKTPKGELVVDLGQNIAGIVRLEVEGESGTEITLRYCEELTPEGNFNVEQLDLMGYQKRARRFYQIDRYVLKGGREVIEPRFTFHGFRYVKIEGYPGDLDLDKIRGLVIYSGLPVTGEFSCTNPLINQLQHNILWSQKGNFLDVPSDCPQREKMGWTGDIQIYAPTACFLMDCSGFLVKWLQDLKADQRDDGLVPHIIPWLPDYPVYGPLGVGGSSGWGDACIIVPWTLYQYYGDKRILDEMYGTMKKWIGFVQRRSKGHVWNKGMHWGDWLEPGKPVYSYFLPWAPKGYVATSFFAHSCHLLSRIAGVLGKRDDAEYYRELSENVRAAYLKRYVKQNGRVKPSRQGAYVLALAFNMVPDEMKPRLAAHLAKMVGDNGNHLDTGFLSTPHLCQVLCENGYEETAFEVLNQDTIPSWLYEVKKGATSVWETWDCIKADGKLRKGMSFNHYAFGAVGAWLYRYVAGIVLDEENPGGKHIVLSPHPGGGLTEARAAYQSPRGEVKSAWKLHDGWMTYSVTVPANSTATVRLPNAVKAEISEGNKPLEKAEGISKVSQEAGAVTLEVGSGSYEFQYRYT
ncbi:MAG TPA: family 78 glycoside hydrolase catalytic domain [Dehalococcoidia bacterium]|nr:family 78 glycoside hydrolase catalytic domain [Dehalococcoidia bacterium]